MITVTVRSDPPGFFRWEATEDDVVVARRGGFLSPAIAFFDAGLWRGQCTVANRVEHTPLFCDEQSARTGAGKLPVPALIQLR